MKKIIAVIGSPKKAEKSVTAKYAKELIDKIKSYCKDVNDEIITIGERKIEMCRGCMTCAKKGVCPIKDDMEEIKQKLRAADFIIFGSPVYEHNVSAQFKCFFDRIMSYFHTVEFIGKPCVNIITTDGSGDRETAKYMNDMSLVLGTINIATLIRNNYMRNINLFKNIEEKKMQKAAKESADILSGKREPKPSFMNGIYFWTMKNKASLFEYESKVWQERGWKKMNYKEASKSVK